MILGTKRAPLCSGASLAFQLFLIKTRFFSLLTIKVHVIKSAKFTYLGLSKIQERNNTIIFSNIKRKTQSTSNFLGTLHTLCGFVHCCLP